MRLEPGATIAGGRYRLDSPLGRGGMAFVWCATDTQLERRVAIKVIADALAEDPDFRRRFEREARAAAAVSHPHVVKLFDYGSEDDRPYLVMEYVDGPNLAELLRSAGPGALDVERHARELLTAVTEIHNAGVIHRDIKPANLLIGPAGDLRVTDFGIARLDETTQITQTGMVVGTERYIAPEVAAGQPATVASDLFSCGAVLQELLGEHVDRGRLRQAADRLGALDPAARPRSAEEALGLLDGSEGPTTPTQPLATGPAPGTAPTAVLQGSPGPPPGTAPTAVLQGAAGAGREARRTSVVIQRGGRPVARLSAAAIAGAAALLALTVAGVLALRGGDDEPRPPLPRPAAEPAPLGEQIDRLDEIVREIDARRAR